MQQNIRRWSLSLCVIIIGTVFTDQTVHAQAYRRIAPQKPGPVAPGKILTPATQQPSATTQSNKVILQKLRGLVFIDNIKALVRTGYTGALSANGIVMKNLPLLNRPRFISQLTPSIGKPLTLSDIQNLSRLVTQWYIRHGRPLMQVTVPPQNISSGIVQVVVTVYKVGRVNVTGNKWFSSQLLRFESGIQTGKPITLNSLQSDLNWLISNPFRRVNAVFSPGAQAGETDVNLQTRDQFPLRVYSGYDNEGVPSLGRSEYNVGFNWGNAFGLDQQLSYQFTRSFSGNYTAHSVDWTIPLPWRDRVMIFGSYEQEKVGLNSAFSSLGESGQASIRYLHPLPAPNWLSQSVGVGYDFKTSNNNLEFGGTQVSNAQNSLNQMLFIYNAVETDRFGSTALNNQLVASFGAFTGMNNSNPPPNEAGLAYPANYLYDQVELKRITRLPWGLSSVTRFAGQIADHNLPDSEQLDAGGVGSVRGYNPETALGSEGELISEEILSPAFDPAGFLHPPAQWHSAAQLGVFIDYADVYQVQRSASAGGRADLASAGVEITYNLRNNLSIDMDYGQQLRRAPGATNKGGEFDIAVVVGF